MLYEVSVFLYHIVKAEMNAKYDEIVNNFYD